MRRLCYLRIIISFGSLAIFAARAMRSAAQRLNSTASLAAPLSNAPVVHMGQTPCKCACRMADEPANSRHYSGGGLHHTSADEHVRCDDEPAAHCPSGDGSAPSPEKHPQTTQ